MESFLPFLLNVSYKTNWTWLGAQIVANKPFTVRVHCTERIDVYPLLQVLARDAVPWSTHKDTRTLPTLYWDMILILSNNETDMQTAISKAANTVRFSYRSRYVAVYLGYIEKKVIENMANFAWVSGLRQFSAVRFADRAIFVAEPHCHLPRITQVTVLQWPELTKLDLTNCTLTAGYINNRPYLEYNEHTDTLSGLYAPVFRFGQSGLKFKSSFVELTVMTIYKSAVVGKLPVDMIIAPLQHSLGWDVDIVGDWIDQAGWCIPDNCVLRDTTYLLWQEFSIPVWILITVSAIGVSFALKLTASPPGVILSDSFLVVILTLAGQGAKVPGGHARWALSGWLWASMVLTSCYQSALHSMMTAPSSGLEISDLDGLSKSNLDFLAIGESHAWIQWDGTRSKALAVIAERTKPLSLKEFYKAVERKNFARFLQHTICVLKEKMTPLPNYVNNEARAGYLGLAAGSWLSPAFHRNFYLMEQSGLAGRWRRRNRPRQTCSHESDGAKPLFLSLLQPGFLLMGAGFSFALIAFVAEHLYDIYKNVCCANA